MARIAKTSVNGRYRNRRGRLPKAQFSLLLTLTFIELTVSATGKDTASLQIFGTFSQALQSDQNQFLISSLPSFPNQHHSLTSRICPWVL